jgi:hypothetical protein
MSAAVEKIPSIDIVGVKISFSSMVLYIFCLCSTKYFVGGL